MTLHYMSVPTLTSGRNTVTSASSSQCRYFIIISKECYASRLQTMVTSVDGKVCCNFHRMVQCYGPMLCSNFLHLITSFEQHLLHDTVHNDVILWCYLTCLCVPLKQLHSPHFVSTYRLPLHHTSWRFASTHNPLTLYCEPSLTSRALCS